MSALAPSTERAALWQAFWAVFHDWLEDEPASCVVTSRTDGEPRLNPGSAIAFAADCFGLSIEQLLSDAKQAQLVDARALAVWGLRTAGAGWSYPMIGRAMGGRDHTTIMNLKRRADRLITQSPRFAGACEDLRAHFRNDLSQETKS